MCEELEIAFLVDEASHEVLPARLEKLGEDVYLGLISLRQALINQLEHISIDKVDMAIYYISNDYLFHIAR